MQENGKWKYVVESEGKRLELNFREVWQYRDLIFLFVKRDFTSKYKQMRLGLLWALITPIMNTVVFTVVFGNLAKLTTLDVPDPGDMVVPAFLFYMIGNVLWNYFSAVVNETSKTLIRNATIMSKVSYPRLVSPIASALLEMITAGINLLLFAALAVVFSLLGAAVIHPSPGVLLIPLLIVQIMLLGMGVGLILAAATTRNRDIIMMISFALRLWFYATPVIYGLQFFPERWRPLILLNPVSPIITTIRYLCFGEGFFEPSYYLISCAVCGLIFFAGVLVFNRAKRNSVDTI